MISSRPAQYFCHQELIEQLNFLQNETKKCGFCKKSMWILQSQ